MAAWLEALEGGRCRKWKLWWSKGSGPSRRKKAERFEGGKREALARLKAFEAECESMPTEEDPSFADFCSQWNDGRLSTGSISAATHENYAHLLAGLSMHMEGKLSETTAWDVENALAALKSGETPSGRPWGGTSLRTAYKVCHKMMDDAVERGLVRRNPCLSVRPPKADTKRRKSLSLSESAALIAALDPADAHQFAVALMLKTGMRAGECLGARWADVLPMGLLVRREVTKTDAGERVIPLDPETWELLAERMAYVAGKASEAGAEPDLSDALCCADDGRALTYNAMKHWWARNCASFGLDGWTLHEMRHTFATNLAQANVHPSTMAALLGHSSSEITMEIYTHVHSEDMQKAVETLSAARQSAPKSAPNDLR